MAARNGGSDAFIVVPSCEVGTLTGIKLSFGVSRPVGRTNHWGNRSIARFPFLSQPSRLSALMRDNAHILPLKEAIERSKELIRRAHATLANFEKFVGTSPGSHLIDNREKGGRRQRHS